MQGIALSQSGRQMDGGEAGWQWQEHTFISIRVSPRAMPGVVRAIAAVVFRDDYRLFNHRT